MLKTVNTACSATAISAAWRCTAAISLGIIGISEGCAGDGVGRSERAFGAGGECQATSSACTSHMDNVSTRKTSNGRTRVGASWDRQCTNPTTPTAMFGESPWAPRAAKATGRATSKGTWTLTITVSTATPSSEANTARSSTPTTCTSIPCSRQ